MVLNMKIEYLGHSAFRITGSKTIIIDPYLNKNPRACLKASDIKKADIVLVDAPCSGWGVLRRNPDIKWRQDDAALERMPILQAHLLDAYAPLVKKGGRLVFGVCTFRHAETKAVLEKFLATHQEFSLQKAGFFGPHQSDGIFMAAMTKNEP